MNDSKNKNRIIKNFFIKIKNKYLKKTIHLSYALKEIRIIHSLIYVTIVYCIKAANNSDTYLCENDKEDKEFLFLAEKILGIKTTCSLYKSIKKANQLIKQTKERYFAQINYARECYNNLKKIITELTDKQTQNNFISNETWKELCNMRKALDYNFNETRNVVKRLRKENTKIKIILSEYIKYIPLLTIITVIYGFCAYLYIYNLSNFFNIKISEYYSSSDYISSDVSLLIELLILFIVPFIAFIINTISSKRQPKYSNYTIKKKDYSLIIIRYFCAFTIIYKLTIFLTYKYYYTDSKNINYFQLFLECSLLFTQIGRAHV